MKTDPIESIGHPGKQFSIFYRQNLHPAFPALGRKPGDDEYRKTRSKAGRYGQDNPEQQT
jgi:hypothetical protein